MRTKNATCTNTVQHVACARGLSLASTAMTACYVEVAHCRHHVNKATLKVSIYIYTYIQIYTYMYIHNRIYNIERETLYAEGGSTAKASIFKEVMSLVSDYHFQILNGTVKDAHYRLEERSHPFFVQCERKTLCG